MAYQFSFSRRQWWGTVAGLVGLLALMFAAGFVGGAMWQRSRVTLRTEPGVSQQNAPAARPVERPPTERTAPENPAPK